MDQNTLDLIEVIAWLISIASCIFIIIRQLRIKPENNK